ncbi:ANK_REP_REGION domain-containing protein [Trichoderma simmonsii]|nr:ANK_REP_REGION domain-containing protein [Trichoderma simmonsii]
MAIDFAISTKTIFAFLSHDSSSSITALSVVHSLIFQLTSDDEGLQTIFCGSNRENFKNNLDVAIGFLQTLLNSTGLVSIIIDGVDEIDFSEREKLLKKLCEVSTACKKTLILISSRAEHDISAILSQVSLTIRVDTHNAASIQIFIDDWVQTWFSVHDFLREDESEIEGLLASLASKAKGMFLYAKIMLRSIEELDNLDEIRNELRVLPKDLDEAYGRLFEKIDGKSEIVKKKCRLILGWISCSPTPLTLLELEQALVVTISDTSRVSSPLNFVRLCGPIIEVMGDNVQFVHFTVKEYIHSRHKIENYIDLTEATLSLAICCIRYLCQDHHSPDISGKDLEAGIRMGNYRLHYYATDTWLSLVTQYLRLNQSRVVSEELITTLHEFYEERRKQDSSGYTESEEQRYPSELQRFESRNPKLFGFLRGIAKFQQKCSTSLYHLEQEHYWNNLNLTTTSTISKMLYAQFDKFQCPAQQHTDQCLCSILRRHYGPRLYKCGYFSCSFHRYGFDNRFKRESHKKTHDFPWKCDISSCRYSEVGFISKAMRDRHLDIHQAEAQHNSLNKETLLLHSISADILPLLLDLIAIGDLESVEKLPHFTGTIQYEATRLLKLVAQSGSAAMTKLIYKKGIREPTYINEWYDIILAAVKGQNIESLSVLLSGLYDIKIPRFFGQSPISFHCKLLEHSITTDSVEIFQIVDTYLKKVLPKKGVLLALFLSSDVIKATARCPEREEYLINAWSNHGAANASPEPLLSTLIHIAKSTYSIRLARVLLQYGININQRLGKPAMTPLQWAARQDCVEAAEFMKFLLYQGANPDICHGIRKAKCVENISHWLGFTWDELIQKVKEDRERGVQWP